MRVLQRIATAMVFAMPASILAGPASAQSWPARPIEWIVPFAPGGSTDILARLVADRLKDRLGQPIVIVNRPGANSDIGYKAAAAAPADGHTIVLTVPSLVTNPFQLEAALDPSRLAPVIYLAEGPYVLLAPKAFPPGTMAEAVAALRAKPGAVSCAMTGGSGSLACQMLEYFAQGQDAAGSLSRGRAGVHGASWPAKSTSCSASRSARTRRSTPGGPRHWRRRRRRAAHCRFRTCRPSLRRCPVSKSSDGVRSRLPPVLLLTSSRASIAK